jgi:molybdate transport system regulatory protein
MKQAPLIRFRIDFAENSNLGPGKIALLEGIRTHRSMSEAARRMGISYRRAWLLLDSLNKSFDTPATVNSVGGRGGGGAEITPFGVLLIKSYREVERKLNDVAGVCLKGIRARVTRSSAAPVRKVSVSKKRRPSTPVAAATTRSLTRYNKA